MTFGSIVRLYKSIDNKDDKKAIARIFGLGKSSKSKPGPLLDVAKRLYDKIAGELSNNNIFSDD